MSSVVSVDNSGSWTTGLVADGEVSSVIDNVEIEISVEGVIDGGGGSVEDCDCLARPRLLPPCDEAICLITNAKLSFWRDKAHAL